MVYLSLCEKSRRLFGLASELQGRKRPPHYSPVIYYDAMVVAERVPKAWSAKQPAHARSSSRFPSLTPPNPARSLFIFFSSDPAPLARK